MLFVGQFTVAPRRQIFQTWQSAVYSRHFGIRTCFLTHHPWVYFVEMAFCVYFSLAFLKIVSRRFTIRLINFNRNFCYEFVGANKFYSKNSTVKHQIYPIPSGGVPRGIVTYVSRQPLWPVWARQAKWQRSGTPKTKKKQWNQTQITRYF